MIMLFILTCFLLVPVAFLVAILVVRMHTKAAKTAENLLANQDNPLRGYDTLEKIEKCIKMLSSSKSEDHRVLVRKLVDFKFKLLGKKT